MGRISCVYCVVNLKGIWTWAWARPTLLACSPKQRKNKPTALLYSTNYICTWVIGRWCCKGKQTWVACSSFWERSIFSRLVIERNLIMQRCYLCKTSVYPNTLHGNFTRDFVHEQLRFCKLKSSAVPCLLMPSSIFKLSTSSTASHCVPSTRYCSLNCIQFAAPALS